MEISLIVIAVTYNSDFHAINYVNNLSSVSSSLLHHIVLVDNTERDNSDVLFKQVTSLDPRVMSVKSERNLGYFGGANFGLTQYLKEHAMPTWILISNVDISFSSNESFDSLAEIALMDGVGVMAPSITSKHWREDRNPYMTKRPSSATMHFYEKLYRNFYIQNIYQWLAWLKAQILYQFKNILHANSILQRIGYRLSSADKCTDKGTIQYIYAPHGSCIFLSERYFKCGGTLDFPPFLFGEEIFIAEMARQINLEVIYDPRIKVHHDDHVSTEFLRSRQIVEYMHESSLFLLKTYF